MSEDNTNGIGVVAVLALLAVFWGGPWITRWLILRFTDDRRAANAWTVFIWAALCIFILRGGLVS